MEFHARTSCSHDRRTWGWLSNVAVNFHRPQQSPRNKSVALFASSNLPMIHIARLHNILTEPFSRFWQLRRLNRVCIQPQNLAEKMFGLLDRTAGSKPWKFWIWAVGAEPTMCLRNRDQRWISRASEKYQSQVLSILMGLSSSLRSFVGRTAPEQLGGLTFWNRTPRGSTCLFPFRFTGIWDLLFRKSILCWAHISRGHVITTNFSVFLSLQQGPLPELFNQLEKHARSFRTSLDSQNRLSVVSEKGMQKKSHLVTIWLNHGPTHISAPTESKNLSVRRMNNL